MKYGYYYKRFNEYENIQLYNLLEKEKTDQIICEEMTYKSGKMQYSQLEKLLLMMNPGDTFVIPTIDDLRKTVIQLSDFIKDLESKKVHFIVIHRDIEMEKYKEMIHSLSEMEKRLIRMKTSSGLEYAKKEGRLGGRPTISQEIIDRIQFLYNTHKYSSHEIAEHCGVSIGTVYKYIRYK